MGEAHVDAVGDQPVGQFVPAEEGPVAMPLPGAGMHLVDRDRLAARVGRSPMARMRVVLPIPARSAPSSSRHCWGAVPSAGEGVRLQRQNLAAWRRRSRICRPVPLGDAGQEDFPDAGVAAQRIALRRPSHSLKLPTTETRLAFGAQTAKWKPSMPSSVIGWAPSLSKSLRCEPSRYNSRPWAQAPGRS
jgi:hypothetical protein